MSGRTGSDRVDSARYIHFVEDSASFFLQALFARRHALRLDTQLPSNPLSDILICLPEVRSWHPKKGDLRLYKEDLVGWPVGNTVIKVLEQVMAREASGDIPSFVPEGAEDADDRIPFTCGSGPKKKLISYGRHYSHPDGKVMDGNGNRKRKEKDGGVSFRINSDYLYEVLRLGHPTPSPKNAPEEIEAWRKEQRRLRVLKAAEQFKQGIAAKHGANKAKNANNQTEEGMTRAQMKKEAKRLMYLQSTEAAPEMGDIKKLAK